VISETRARQLLGRAFPRGALLELQSSHHWWITVGLIVAISVMYYVFVEFYDTPLKLFFFEVKYDFHGSIYLLAFLYATITLRLVGTIASWILSFGAALPRILYYSIGPNAELHNSLFFVAPFLVALTILLELRWRVRHAQLAAERERERRLHIDHVFRAQETERHRIAQGLHDDVLQRLMAIAVLSENLNGSDSERKGAIAKGAAEIREESLRLAEDLRRLSYDLRPSILDSLGLVSAVDWLAQRLQQETGIHVSLLTRGRPTRLSPLVETKAFRIVQEVLNNIRQHSRATEATVSLRFAPTRLDIKVADNGVGFSSTHVMRQAAERGHLGLLGIRERTESMDGTLTVSSKAEGGTTIVASIPLKPSDASIAAT